MKIYAVGTDRFKNKAVFAEEFNRLSEYRRNKILKLKNERERLLSLAAGYLIRIGLNAEGADEKTAAYAENEHGKPYFLDLNIHFSAAHSKELAVCAFSKSLCGADVESLLRNTDIEKMSGRFFSPDEQKRLLMADDRRLEFFRLWTRKESLLKTCGTGIAYALNTVPTDDVAVLGGAQYRFSEYIVGEYIISVCSADDSFPESVTFPDKI